MASRGANNRIGQILGAIIVLFMVFDGVIHIMKIPPVVEAFGQLGYPLSTAVPLGIVELLCVAAFAVPRTRTIGALLLTGYLGGAIATQLRIGADLFPLLFPALLGVLLWGGLYLRDGRLRTLVAS